MFDKLVVSFLVDEVVGGFFVSVPPGHVAAVYDWGRGGLKKTWGPGLHFKIPFWQTAKLFNAQTLEYTIRQGFNVDINREALGDEPIHAVTSDNVNIMLTGTILFRVNRERVVDLWENIGDDFVSKIVRPISRSISRTVMAGFSSGDLSVSQSILEQRMKERLQAEIEPKGLVVEGIHLSDITPIR